MRDYFTSRYQFLFLFFGLSVYIEQSAYKETQLLSTKYEYYINIIYAYGGRHIIFTINQERLRVLHLCRRVPHHTGIVASVIAAEIIDDQYAIILIDLFYGHVLCGIDGTAVLAPIDR